MNEFANYDPLTAHNHPNPFPPAPECDDQLPLISPVGIGLKGNSYRVEPGTASESEFHLVGKEYDSLDGTWTTDWISENISGGKLKYQYHLRPYTIPQTFTITFALDRPGQPEWEWTTPAIPYIWDADDDGIADVDHIIGVGLSTFFLKKTQDEWNSNLWGAHSEAQAKSFQEKVVYPSDWDRDELNAPEPYEPYAVALEYGIGGDIDAPNIDDLAKILGISLNDLRKIVAGDHNVIKNTEFNIQADNLKDYIDALTHYLNTHFHQDLGFPSGQLAGDGGTGPRNTVYKWLDELTDDTGFYQNADGSFGVNGNNYFTINLPADRVTGEPAEARKVYNIQQYIDAKAELAERNANNNMDARADAIETQLGKDATTLQAILNKVFGGGTINSDGSITWGDSVGKIPVADLNIFAGTATPTNTTYNNALRTRNITTNDIKTLK